MYKSLNPAMININLRFEEVLPLVKKYQFGAVEFSPVQIAEETDLERALDLMGQNGVILSSFGLPVQFQSNANTFNSSFAGLEKSARLARELGCRRCGTYVFSWHDELDYAENFKLHVYRLRLCAEVLAAYGITLALEFLGPKTLREGHKYSFIHTLKDMLELCDAIGVGNLNIMLDAYHCYTAGMKADEFAGVIRSPKDIGIVHVNDAPKGVPLDTLPDTLRYLPGEGGAIDLKGFLCALEKIGYTGPVICEPFSERLKSITESETKVNLVEESFNRIWPS